jgi:4-diphosphocytidyl-2-C-methyl-D-erythritol kinase
MWIKTSASAATPAVVEVWAPAKLNLFLEVLGKRPDGYHELETLMVPVSLCDWLSFTSLPPGAAQKSGTTESETGQPGNGRSGDNAPSNDTDSLGGSTGLGNSASAGKRASAIVFSGQWANPGRGGEGQEHSSSASAARGGRRAGGADGSSNQHPIPQGADNLVVKAVELLRRRAGTDAGATIRLVKRIPMAAGLGGGSSDAAAALAAANLAWRLGYSARELMPLAAEVGSDVPFFLAGAAAVCRGRGERVEPLRPRALSHFVIVQPPGGLATADVYRRCRPASSPQTCGALIAALHRGDLSAAGRHLHNALERAAEQLSPWITHLKEDFNRLDLPGHQMTGSGTSYFGLCRSARHARWAAARLRSLGWSNVCVVSGSL